MSSKRVFVTGATGTVGRPLVTHLREDGFDVLAIVSPGGSDAPPGSIEIDLSVPGLVLESMIEARPDAVIHLAALVPRGDRHDTPANADATRRIDAAVAGACAHWRVPVVYASGCGLYDAFDPREKDENARLIPRTHYQVAKREGEFRFASLQHACIARLSSPYHEEMREGSVLVRFLDAARRGEALQVWGTGQREQDFIHCSDIGDFISRAVRAGASGVFNVAQGYPVTMAELAQASVRAAGRGRVHIGSRDDPEEGATARISIEKAKRVLGWTPRISLDQGLALCRGTAECKTSHDL